MSRPRLCDIGHRHSSVTDGIRVESVGYIPLKYVLNR